MLHTEGWWGSAPVEVCTEVQYPCKANGSIPCQSFVNECHLFGQPFDMYLQFRRPKCPSRPYISLGNFHTPFSSSSNIRNSKLRESTGIKCSTGLFMHDLIIDINIMIMQICGND